MVAYGEQAAGRGLKAIIAGAGGAAHLPGMLASVTPLPVIGVPVPLKYLDGMDSLLSIVQMPAGVPGRHGLRRRRPQRRPARRPHPRHAGRGTPRPDAGVPAGAERPGHREGQAAARQGRGRRRGFGFGEVTDTASRAAMALDAARELLRRVPRRRRPQRPALGAARAGPLRPGPRWTSPPTRARTCTPTSRGCAPAASARSSGRCTCARTCAGDEAVSATLEQIDVRAAVDRPLPGRPARPR